MARLGKIARLPSEVREELNRRIRSGALGPQLVPWLNSLPEVRAVLEEHFQNKDINAENLSAWRNGGYDEWEKKQDTHFQRIERTRELAALSMKIAEAGGTNLTEGASAIVAGEILGVLEELERFKAGVAADLTTEDSAPDKFQVAAAAIESLSLSISRLRKGDQNKEALRQRDEQLRQKDEDLKLAKASFDQRLKEYQDKVSEQKHQIEEALGVAKTGGLTPETLKRIEEAARLL